MSAPDLTRDRRLEDLRFLLQGSKRDLAVLSAMALVSAVAETFLLAAIVQSISALSRGRSELSLDLGPLSLRGSVTLVLFLAVVAAVLRGGFTAVVALTGPRIAAGSRQRMRSRLFGSYLRADWATQSSDKTGRFLQTFSTSVNDANTLLVMLTQALPALITLVVLLGLAVVLNPLVTGVIVVLGLVIGSGLRPLSRRANAAAHDDAASRNHTVAHVAGVMAAGGEVAVMGARKGVLSVADQRIARAEGSFARAQGYKRLVSMAAQSVAFLIAAVSLWALSLGRWDVDFAVVGTIAVLLLRCAGLAQQVQTATSLYGAVIPFIRQVRIQIAHYDQNRQAYGTTPFPPTADITLDDVTYRYPGTDADALVVERATLGEGRFIGVLGASGSGKSTLIQVLLRLRAPTAGQVRIGGLPAEAIDEADFSSHVAYVPQSPHLIVGTVMENITFFREGITEAAAVEAARLANVHEEIERLPQGYDTVLDTHVDALSGGQRQRLSLARALTTSPRILVLDEPTSALDAANEAAVVRTLTGLRGRTTVVMITHKLSTVENCDTVFTVERGLLREQPAGSQV